jgi:hypothetical protein
MGDGVNTTVLAAFAAGFVSFVKAKPGLDSLGLNFFTGI